MKDLVIAEKLKEYNAYLKRAIHAESIIDNITAGVRDKFESELSTLESQEIPVNVEKMLKGCEHDGSFMPVSEVKRLLIKYAQQGSRVTDEMIEKFADTINYPTGKVGKICKLSWIYGAKTIRDNHIKPE